MVMAINDTTRFWGPRTGLGVMGSVRAHPPGQSSLQGCRVCSSTPNLQGMGTLPSLPHSRWQEQHSDINILPVLVLGL